MFSFLKKAPVETPLPPQPSNKERIAKVVKDANDRLESITKTVEASKKERREIQTKLSPLSTRAADLQTAIAHAETMLVAAPNEVVKEKVNDLANIARLELEENLEKQKELRHELNAANSFLEDAIQQVTALKARIVSLETDFNSLDIREAEASVLRDMGHIDQIVHDYRREVFAIEAHAELAQS